MIFSGLRSDHKTTTKLSYTLNCDKNYYLPCCNIYCEPQNNIKGHYKCDPETGAKICFPDYVGIDCNIKKCPTGYEWNNVTNSCVDINECLTSTPCQQMCTNTEGSYFCSCEEGFYLSSFTDCSLILLAGTTLSSTSVGLNWQTAHDFSLYYSVYYREVTYYIQVTDIFYFYSSTNGLEIIVTGLLSYRSYELYVIATWTNGTNGTIVSNTVTVRTNQDTPSLPPTNLIGVSKNATKLTLYWSAISQGSQNGIIVGYSILINRISNSGQGLGTTEHLRDASSVSYKITDLTAHTKYSISVAAATSVGKGPYSAAISVRISGSASTQYFFIDPCNKTNLLYGGS